MTAAHSATLLLSAVLLFVVQPMIAKSVLPSLGGSPAVWTTCLAFFQAVLLAGYAYAAALARCLSPRAQVVVHLLLLTALGAGLNSGRTAASEPLLPSSPPVEMFSPTAWLLSQLVQRDALPLMLVAATAPLLQRWFSLARRSDPYFLYAASNMGSLLALLSYPVVIEPSIPLHHQAHVWRIGFAALTAMVAICGIPIWLRPPLPVDSEPAPAAIAGPLRAWVGWAALAGVPSSLLLGLTQYLTQDVAAVPLLWVLPLALYLLTYVTAFARRPWTRNGGAGRLFPLFLMALGPSLAAGLVRPWWLWLPLHLAAFTVAALACHTTLAERRPPAAHLTAFYLAIALGGAVGGLFNAVLAPWIFDRAAEYPLALVLAALLLGPTRGPQGGERRAGSDLAFALGLFALIALLARYAAQAVETVLGGLGIVLAAGLLALAAATAGRRPARFALSFGAVVAGCGLWPGRDGETLLRHRDFFGILRVTRDETARCIRLFHGSTLHGEQSLDPERRREPRAYFDRSGPAGDLFAGIQANPSPRQVAVVGLGCGTLAAYAEPGERWTFFELDPAVIPIAGDPRYFTYLAESRADETRIVIGDGRLRLAEESSRAFDAILLDAFGSDAVPVHLLTREALGIYRTRLRRGGWLAFNLSNRYLDLEPVVAALAASEGLVCRIRADLDVSRRETAATGKQPTIWAVMAEPDTALGPLDASPCWRPARARNDLPAWTDESSNLFRSLVLGRRGIEPSADRTGRPPAE